jgi:hypothetical protein
VSGSHSAFQAGLAESVNHWLYADNRGSIPGMFFPIYVVLQAGRGAYQTSSPVSTRGCVRWIKRPELEADHTAAMREVKLQTPNDKA